MRQAGGSSIAASLLIVHLCAFDHLHLVLETGVLVWAFLSTLGIVIDIVAIASSKDASASHAVASLLN